jgi:hypothetical protein
VDAARVGERARRRARRTEPRTDSGFTGLAYISGMVSRTDRRTHAKVELPFLFNDMRFMDGEYRGFDGRVRRGTFGFI